MILHSSDLSTSSMLGGQYKVPLIEIKEPTKGPSTSGTRSPRAEKNVRLMDLMHT